MMAMMEPAASNVWELVALVSDLVLTTVPEDTTPLIRFNNTRLALLQAVGHERDQIHTTAVMMAMMLMTVFVIGLTYCRRPSSLDNANSMMRDTSD